MKNVELALWGAVLLSSCSDTALVNISDDVPNQLNQDTEGSDISFAPGDNDMVDLYEFGDDDDDSSDIVEDPDPAPEPFTLSELTSACIPDDILCEEGAMDCVDVNSQLQAIREHWAEEISDECGLEATIQGILDGDFNDRCRATVIGKDTYWTNDGVDNNWAALIAVAGATPRALMLNSFIQHDPYGHDPLLCETALNTTADGEILYRVRDAHMLDDNNGQIIAGTEITIQPCVPDDSSLHCAIDDMGPLWYFDGTPEFDSLSSWVDAGRSPIIDLVAKISTLSPGDPNGPSQTLPVATTELTNN